MPMIADTNYRFLTATAFDHNFLMGRAAVPTVADSALNAGALGQTIVIHGSRWYSMTSGF